MSSLNLSDDQLAKLKEVINQLSNDPSILNRPELAFFKSFIEKLGGRVPRDETKFEENASKEESETKPDEESESEESDIELDMTGVIGIFYFIVFIYIMFLSIQHII